jgi:hypothetical protein
MRDEDDNIARIHERVIMSTQCRDDNLLFTILITPVKDL